MGKGANRDALENDYVEYYENFGIDLLPIPNVSKDLEKYFDEIPIKGIILSGGNDVNPQLYGGKLKNEDFSEQRDNTEKKLIEIALERKLPLLGNCRGAHFINVFFKGSLIQNVKAKTGFDHVGTPHKVKITDEKVTEFFNKKEFEVNSYHNQGIMKDTLSSELKEFAISEDGIVEGFYHPKYQIAGILWHPERPGSDKESDKRLIEAFLNRRMFWKS
ncbi:gamma-glutamyl-gamma-aminobutyrate hydrolase family protein [archaeon AH-315-M20]|nr:gamma-glutamyl-gamma-aminobutyrate hydrolase family protein [archaeon AH-315-M20]